MVCPRPHRLTDPNLQPSTVMQLTNLFTTTYGALASAGVSSRILATTHGALALAGVSCHHILATAALCVLALPTAATAAEAPRKAPLTRYAELWTKSPFTTPPKKDEVTPEANIFEDLALRGLAPLSKGHYLITWVNKKNPTETTTIDTERSTEYEVVKIERDSEKALGTIVHLKKGSMTGTLTYDEKLSTLKPPAPPKKDQHGNQPPNPGQPPNPPGAPPNPQAQGSPPPLRARVLPPATPAVTPPTTNGANRGQPGSTTNRFQPGGGDRSSRSDHGPRGR